ncbi:Hypothetical protein A7982_05900 [Minicystis rosea]|nr:Hypothetical protein A7982_05900 [Minicystis rosea]
MESGTAASASPFAATVSGPTPSCTIECTAPRVSCRGRGRQAFPRGGEAPRRTAIGRRPTAAGRTRTRARAALSRDAVFRASSTDEASRNRRKAP